MISKYRVRLWESILMLYMKIILIGRLRYGKKIKIKRSILIVKKRFKGILQVGNINRMTYLE